jgi:hypothetical protein
MTFEFKGPAGQSMDPTPFYKNNLEQISIATGYPQAKLVGAQAGAVTGSEVNQLDYYKAISRDQQAIEDAPRWIIDRLADSGQISMIATATDKQTSDYRFKLIKSTLKRLIKRDYRHRTSDQYVINWTSPFQLSEADEANVEEIHTRACVNKLSYMSKDEVRAEEGLDPLPDGMGEWQEKPVGLQLFNQKGVPNDPKNPQAEDPQQQALNQADKFLLIDLNPKPEAVKHEHNHNSASRQTNPAK